MLRSLILSLGVPAALAAQASPRATPTSAPAAAPSPAATPLSAPPASPRPTLVVFLTVDQLTEDYFTRFAPQLTGGLRRLWSGGAVFTNAHHDHGTTETAPGHAATMSGRFPMHTGIVRNNAGVQDEQAPLVGASGPGASRMHWLGVSTEAALGRAWYVMLTATRETGGWESVHQAYASLTWRF